MGISAPYISKLAAKSFKGGIEAISGNHYCRNRLNMSYAWDKSRALVISKNIRLVFIPPYMPEMNPIEQILKENRKRGFRNEIFQTLDKVIESLCSII